jgi:hypothetical protein
MPSSYLCYDWTWPKRGSNPNSWHPNHIVIKRFAALYAKHTLALLLPMGSLLEVTGKSGRWSIVRVPGGPLGGAGGTRLRISGECLREIEGGERRRLEGVSQAPGRRLRKKDFPSIAAEVIGSPYLWGGKSTFGFDCSGLVQLVFEMLGVDLPRNSNQQARCGKPVRRREDFRPFDLFFFGEGRRINHVGIHLGGLDVLHASGYVCASPLMPRRPYIRGSLCESFRWARRVIR